ncbi:MAG TPA: DUF58 domain-containing protein [Hydrogenispora sp.]|nr:DUF58 domain-containing protein [Hydrogenispora sp.]
MRRRIGVLSLTVFLLTAVSFVPAVTLYVLVGLLLFSWWGQRKVALNLRVVRAVIKGQGFVGDDLRIKIRVVNPTMFPVPWCRAEHSFSQLSADRSSHLFSLPSGGQAEIDLKVRGERRGVYLLPPSRLFFGDHWGLTEQSMTATGEEKITIFPPVRPLQGFAMSRRSPVGPYRLHYSLYEDPTRLQGSREYLPGDSLKKMHWPNVARTGILQVKEWETTLTSDYGIFLNLREEDLPTNAWYFLTEFLVELAASLSHFFAVQNETIAFYCNGKPFGAGEGPFRLPPKRGRHLVEKILTYLAGVSPGQGQAVEVFFREAARLPARSILLFLTPVITPVMVEKAAHLRRNGFQPVFLWPYYRDGVLPTTDLRKANLKWYIVRKGGDRDEFTFTGGE